MICLSFIPGQTQSIQRFNFDKIFHLMAFAYLGYLAGSSFKWWIIIPLLVFGLINELQQYFSPGRQVAVWDLLANEAGIIIGFIISYFRRRRAFSES